MTSAVVDEFNETRAVSTVAWSDITPPSLLFPGSEGQCSIAPGVFTQIALGRIIELESKFEL